MRENNHFEFNRENTKRILQIISFTLVLYFILRNISEIFSVTGKFFSVLSPFITGFCIAFVINVTLRPLEKLWDRIFSKPKLQKFNKGKRAICLVLSILIIVSIILAVFLVIIPEFKNTLEAFIDALPYNIDKTQRWIHSISKNFDLPNFMEMSPSAIANEVKEYLSLYGQNVLNKTFDVTSSLFSAVAKFVIGFILSIYMLAQKEKLIGQIKRTLFVLLPENKANILIKLTRLTNRTFTNFVTGQLTEAVIIGCLCFIGMTFLNIPYAPVVSVLVGFTALIPVFGAFIGTAIGAFLILLSAPVKALWFIIFIVVLQQIEGNLIYPKVVGKSVGLPGIWVLSAVTVGGSLFGFTGMLICVPVCSVLYTLLKSFIIKKES